MDLFMMLNNNNNNNMLIRAEKVMKWLIVTIIGLIVILDFKHFTAAGCGQISFIKAQFYNSKLFLFVKIKLLLTRSQNNLLLKLFKLICSLKTKPVPLLCLTYERN